MNINFNNKIKTQKLIAEIDNEIQNLPVLLCLDDLELSGGERGISKAEVDEYNVSFPAAPAHATLIKFPTISTHSSTLKFCKKLKYKSY